MSRHDSLVACVVCAHASRIEMEASAGEPGADIREVAVRFGVTKASLVKHMSTHPCAAHASTDSPPAFPLPPNAGRPDGQPHALTLLEDEAAPVTSRSEEISARAFEPRSARAKVERFFDALDELADVFASRADELRRGQTG